MKELPKSQGNEEKIVPQNKLEKAKIGLKSYRRVGDKYFKEVFVPDKIGQLHRKYIERQRATIIDDFGREFLPMIKRYEGFVNIPSHTNFLQEIHGFFNEYFPLTHQLCEGNFETIQHILTHIFAEKIDFAFDYLQLLYLKPTQRLPIILLESEQKNTGKSTFGNLVKLIFQDNAIKLGNGDLESDFNSIWVKRLCLVVDETALEKKSIMQMLKRLSTETGKVTFNEKNRVQTQTDFFGKFIFMSNEEGKALPIERGDPRFAIFKVPTFKEKGYAENPNIENLIEKEIPAFLNFLKNRNLVHTEQSRMYFAHEIYRTKQLLIYFESSVSYVAKAIKELIKDTFAMYPEESELRFSESNILNELRTNAYAKNADRQQVKKALELELHKVEEVKQRYTFFSLNMTENSSSYYPTKNIDNNRIYTFKPTDF